MKRLPLAASFLLFILLCVSIAYWAMQLFKPPLRPVAAPPRAVADIRPQAAAVLFGGRAGTAAVASNYHLNGVVMSGTPDQSVAILSVDGKPAKAVLAGKEIVPGVSVKEVHRNYVLLSDNGVVKRVDLPQSAKVEVDFAALAPVNTAPAANAPGPSAAPPGTPATPAAAPPPAAVPNPPNAPAPGAPSASSPQSTAPNLATPPATMTAPPGIVVRPPAR